MTHIAKVVEIIGGSDIGWSEAAQAALDEAKKTNSSFLFEQLSFIFSDTFVWGYFGCAANVNIIK